MDKWKIVVIVLLLGALGGYGWMQQNAAQPQTDVPVGSTPPPGNQVPGTPAPAATPQKQSNAKLFQLRGKVPPAWNIEKKYWVNTAAPVALALALYRSSKGGVGSRGSVVNILDQRIRNPVPDQFSYGLSKGALAAATRLLAISLAPSLRVNAVAPGLTLPTADYDAALMHRLTAAMPLARLPSPADIADAVVFLANAASVTGQTVFVDGGASLKSFDRDFVNL